MYASVTSSVLAMEMAFTEVYRRCQDAHPAIREAICLRAQYPALLGEIREGDRFAGRIDPEHQAPAVGFLMGVNSPEMGFICSEGRLRSKLQALGAEEEHEQDLRHLLEFWQDRTTASRFWSRVMTERPENVARAFPDQLGPTDLNEAKSMIAAYGDRMATANLDFDKLLRLGLPGMFEEVERCRARAAREGGDELLFKGMRMCLELLEEVCRWYAAQAREKRLSEVAQTLERIVAAPPGALHEAIQLFWLYAMLANVHNFGRMDIYLGDFLAHDLDSGRISEDEAFSIMQYLWKMISSLCGSYSGAGRVIIGGRGRRNEENANRFALLAMEATRATRVLNPQLTLRIHQGMDPALMKKAVNLLGEGLTFPILVNDDVNVPALQRAFSATREEAEQYVLTNCGDVTLDHLAFGSPNSFINLAKALEVTLRNGREAMSGLPMGLALGSFEDFASFDQLMSAYQRQVEFFVDNIADRHQIFNEVLGESPFLFLSMLSDDCLERGRAAFAGGLRYLGGLLETYGNITTADSLNAIKELVYDKKLLTRGQMLATLDANFKGYERERMLMRNVPKFGNDDPSADAMVARVNDHLFAAIWRQKDRTSMNYLLGEYVNAGGNVQLGRTTGATADGRLAGQPLANANNPSSGSDRSGVTALLNSMAKLDVSLIGPGVFQNLHLNRNLFQTTPEKVRALLESFFAHGGAILQVTATSRKDLEDALENPEKHQSLVVRIGGLSARFIELDRDLQLDILQRTVY